MHVMRDVRLQGFCCQLVVDVSTGKIYMPTCLTPTCRHAIVWLSGTDGAPNQMKREMLQHTLEMVEKELSELTSHERLYVIDSVTGEILYRGDGYDDPERGPCVEWPQDKSIIQGNIVTHNHPTSAASLSNVDVCGAIAWGAKQTRVVSSGVKEKRVYRMEIPEEIQEAPSKVRQMLAFSLELMTGEWMMRFEQEKGFSYNQELSKARQNGGELDDRGLAHSLWARFMKEEGLPLKYTVMKQAW